MMIWLLLLLHVIQSLAKNNDNYYYYQIRHVQVITRHGDRTPVHTVSSLPDIQWYCHLPNDVSINPLEFASTSAAATTPFAKIISSHGAPLSGNCSMGQLTDIGMKQHYNLGQYFSKRYESLKLWSDSMAIQEQIQIESTDVPRTIQSAQSQFLGLVPAEQREAMQRIYTQSEGTCDMYPNFILCPRIALLKKQALNSEKFKQFEKEHLPLKENILKMLGVESFPGWTSLYDVFTCIKAHNHSLSDAWSEELIQKITLAAETEYSIIISDKEFLSLAMGPFLKRIKQEMSKAINPSDNRYIRFSLHSGHDTTIAPLANLLNFWDKKWPKYAANIVIELYEKVSNDGTSTDEDRYAVKILYNGNSVTSQVCNPFAQIDKQSQKQDDFFCPWSQFNQLTDELLAKDHEHVCLLVHNPEHE